MLLAMLTKIKPFILAQIRDRKIGDSGQSANNKLPVELLVEIFLYCLSTDRFPIPSRAEAPILLGRVCRAWRSVSLNTPQLWAQITLSSSHPLDIWKSETFHRIGIREWIRRSGNSTLSFEIGVHPEEHISAPFLTLVLQAEAHRWKGVRLGTNCDCIDHILDMLCIQGKTPMLTDIRFLNKYALKKRHPRITCAPQVNTMYFRSADTLILGSGEFQALRELRINPYGLRHAYVLILTQCPMLEILEILSSPTLFILHGTTLVHTLRRLHTFIVEGSGGYAQLRLLNLFDTPALNSLAISIWKDQPTQFSEATHLSNFLIRCGGQLRRLKLAGSFVSCGDIVDSLRHTPILESLCIESFMLTEDFTAICTSLVHFDILPTWPQSSRTLNAVGVILSRWKDSRLKEDVGTASPYIIRVPSISLSEAMKDQDVKECIQKGLRIAQLPSDEESWWVSRLPWPDFTHMRTLP